MLLHLAVWVLNIKTLKFENVQVLKIAIANIQFVP